MGSSKSDTICWGCKKACGGCSWSKGFIPVDGWEAEKTRVRQFTDVYIDSYMVKSCPEFERDDPPKYIELKEAIKKYAKDIKVTLTTIKKRMEKGKLSVKTIVKHIKSVYGQDVIMGE